MKREAPVHAVPAARPVPSGVRRVGPAEAAARKAGAAPGEIAPELSVFLAKGVPPVKAIARRFAVSFDEAEEIRQDVLLAMLRTPEPIQAPIAWFWEAASRRKRRYVDQKVRAKRFEPALHVLARSQRSPFPAPDAALEQREQQRAMHDVLEQVKPARRDVAELRLLGYDEAEVAAELDLPVGTVRSRWARAKKDARSKWAALTAMLTALLLRLVWLGRRAREAAGHGAAVAGGALPGGARRGRGWGLLACAACAVLPIAMAARPAALRSPMGDVPPVEDAPVRGPPGRWLPFTPVLSANAERERESPSHGRLPGATVSRGRSSGVVSAGDPRSPRSAAHRESARRHLASARRTFQEHQDRRKALRLLEPYERTSPEDPFPVRCAGLVKDLRVP